MIVLQLFTGERLMVNEANITCIKEARDQFGNYSSHVYVGKMVCKVRQSFEEIAQLLGCDGVALPVYETLDRKSSSTAAAAPKPPLTLEDKFKRDDRRSTEKGGQS